MAWPDDLREQMLSDHEIWNDVETITYYAKTGKTIGAGVTVNGAKRFMIRKDFLPPDSALLKMDMRWQLPVAELGGIVPKIDDLFQDGFGVRWVIKVDETTANATTHRVACLRLQGVA